MKTLTLVAVILQVVITAKAYKFGDIIEFPRYCVSNTAKPIYKHYAVYVGPKSERDVGQGDNNDIYHRTGPDWTRNCRFDKLETTSDGSKDREANFLDGIEGYTVGTPDEITARIKQSLKACTSYFLTTNNCEHLATHVRYGRSMSLQRGTVTECFMAIKQENRNLLAEVRANMQLENECEPHRQH